MAHQTTTGLWTIGGPEHPEKVCLERVDELVHEEVTPDSQQNNEPRLASRLDELSTADGADAPLSEGVLRALAAMPMVEQGAAQVVIVAGGGDTCRPVPGLLSNAFQEARQLQAEGSSVLQVYLLGLAVDSAEEEWLATQQAFVEAATEAEVELFICELTPDRLQALGVSEGQQLENPAFLSDLCGPN